MKLLSTPSFAGTGASFTVGGRNFLIPATARVRIVRHKRKGELAWVEDNGHLFAFTAAGQVDAPIPDDLRSAVLRRYFT